MNKAEVGKLAMKNQLQKTDDAVLLKRDCVFFKIGTNPAPTGLHADKAFTTS